MTQFKGTRSVKDIMSGVHETPTWTRKRKNNTVEYGLADGTRVFRLHDTDIIKFMPNGDLILNSGGWQTRTTKDRFNEFLPSYAGRIFQHQNVWYLSMNGETFAYQDGLTITPTKSGYKVKNAANVKRLNKYQTHIKEYVKGYCKALFNYEIPAPSAGDCWYCVMVEEKTKRPLGEVSKNKDHIISHMKEKYYVPSLVVNACKRFNISRAGWYTLQDYLYNTENSNISVFQAIGNRQIKSSLTRYMRSQLGMAD